MLLRFIYSGTAQSESAKSIRVDQTHPALVGFKLVLQKTVSGSEDSLDISFTCSAAPTVTGNVLCRVTIKSYFLTITRTLKIIL